MNLSLGSAERMLRLFLSTLLLLFIIIVVVMGIYLVLLFFFPSGLHNTFKGHTDWIRCLAFAPDGSTIATGSKDRTARIWDLATGRERAILRGHTDEVWSLAFAPDNKVLATASQDGTLKIWDVATGCEVESLSGPELLPLYAVAFAPDGHILAYGGYDNAIRLWDMITRTEIRVLKGHSSAVRSLSFNSCGTLLASRSADGIVYVWDTKDWALRRRLGSGGISDYIYCVSFSPDGITLALNGCGRGVKLWNAATGQERLFLRVDEGWPICSIAFSPDGKILAGSSLFGYSDLRCWDTSTGKLICQRSVNSAWALAFSPDGNHLATGGRGCVLNLWDVSSLLKRK